MSNRIWQIVLLLILLWPDGPARAQNILGRKVGETPSTVPAVFALTGAIVHIGNGEVLENATVVLRDGLIEAVGQQARSPEDAWILNLQGMHIYPGLIDSLTEVGLAKRRGQAENNRPAAPPGAPPGRDPEGEDPEGPGLFPHLSATDQIDSQAKEFKGWRDSGILSLNVAPTEGIIMGRTGLINLNGKDADRMIVNSPTAMRMSFQGQGFRAFPGSLMGVIAHLRQTLLDAQHYGEVHKIYAGNRRGLPRPETDRALEELQPVVKGLLPAIFPASREREIRRVLDLAREFRLKTIVAGGVEAARLSSELKAAAIPVLVSLNFPEPPKERHPEAEDSLEEMEFRLQARRSAAELEKTGVLFAFYSDGVKNGKEFLKALRTAVENGLSKEAALRATTLDAARILGAGEQLGSLETGKIANLMVTEGDLFDEKSRIRHVFVDGEKYDISVEKEPEEQKETKEGKQSPE